MPPHPMAALLTIAKTWQQPKCASTYEWIKRMWCICIYIYSGMLLSHEKNKTMPFAVVTWMQLEIIIISCQ